MMLSNIVYIFEVINLFENVFFVPPSLCLFKKERLFVVEFVKYNANPKGRKTTDCVIRALCTALNDSWENTYRNLVDYSIRQGLMCTEKRAFTFYLNAKGYKMEKMPKRGDNTRYTVQQFANEIAKPKTVYILNLANHLTVIKDGVLLDTWNCSQKYVGNYWVIR